MAKPTIKALQEEVETLRELRKGDLEHQQWQAKEVATLRDLVETLKADKSWLKQMHSAMLQATAEMFRNR